MKKTLFIIDAYNLIYRMFYAVPEMTTRTGEYVNAIFGVAKFLKWVAWENPDAAMVIATDIGKSFRADIFSEYKGTRERMPDNLKSQIAGVFELFSAAGILTLSREWYEADDIIGTIAHQHENNEYQIVIVSSDKDLCQFVRDGHVHIFDAMKHKFIKESDVIEKFGVPVYQVCDYLAIVGDTSDNIPGISGFGPKKAVDLLTKYGTLEGIYENLADLTPKMQEVLIAQKDNAFLSQKLARIITDLDIPALPEAPFAPGILQVEYIELMKQYEFRSLIPMAHQLPKKELAQFKVEPIDTLAWLENLELILRWDNSEEAIILSTDSYGKMVIGFLGHIYSIDSKKIDTSEFIVYILGSDREIVGYDLKTNLKQLLQIQKPLQNEVEGQGRLF